MEVYQKLRVLRENKGYTQASFAFEIDMSQSGYAKIEEGTTQITVTRLLEFSKVLKVNPCKLLCIEDYAIQEFPNAEREAMKAHIVSLEKIIDKLLDKQTTDERSI